MVFPNLSYLKGLGGFSVVCKLLLLMLYEPEPLGEEFDSQALVDAHKKSYYPTRLLIGLESKLQHGWMENISVKNKQVIKTIQ